jgi:hypothetical protein
VRVSAADANAVRRLARLFRIERHGGFARRPPAIAARLVQRRGELVEAVQRLDPGRSDGLDEALALLAREVDLALPLAAARVAALAAELQDGRPLRLLGRG